MRQLPYLSARAKPLLSCPTCRRICMWWNRDKTPDRFAVRVLLKERSLQSVRMVKLLFITSCPFAVTISPSTRHSCRTNRLPPSRAPANRHLAAEKNKGPARRKFGGRGNPHIRCPARKKKPGAAWEHPAPVKSSPANRSKWAKRLTKSVEPAENAGTVGPDGFILGHRGKPRRRSDGSWEPSPPRPGTCRRRPDGTGRPRTGRRPAGRRSRRRSASSSISDGSTPLFGSPFLPRLAVRLKASTTSSKASSSFTRSASGTGPCPPPAGDLPPRADRIAASMTSWRISASCRTVRRRRAKNSSSRFFTSSAGWVTSPFFPQKLFQAATGD